MREQELGRLRTDLGETLATATAALGQELQSLLPRALRATLEQLFDAAALRERLGEARALTPAPVVLEPLTLSRARRFTLMATDQGRGVWHRLRRQPLSPEERQRALWRLTLKAALTDGQEARRHGLLNARENYKHRYAFVLLGQLYDGLERALVDALAGHQAQLQALEEAQRLLLGSDARQAAEALLEALEAPAAT